MFQCSVMSFTMFYYQSVEKIYDFCEFKLVGEGKFWLRGKMRHVHNEKMAVMNIGIIAFSLNCYTKGVMESIVYLLSGSFQHGDKFFCFL